MKRVMAFVHGLVFDQPSTGVRLAALRVSLGTVIAALTLGTEDSFYVDAGRYLHGPAAFGLPYVGEFFRVAKGLTLVLAILFALGYRTRAVTVGLCLTFGWVNAYLSGFSTTVWNYNTHLNWFLLVLCGVDAGRCCSIDAHLRRSIGAARPASTEGESFVLAFMQAYVAVLYFQAGLSKLIFSGPEWFTSGQTLYVFTIRGGMPLGLYLAQFPDLFRVFGMLTAVFELGFLAVGCCRRAHPLLGVIGIGFHVGIYTVMGISFWHLWVLYPALFIVGQVAWVREPSPASPEVSLAGAERSARIERQPAVQG